MQKFHKWFFFVGGGGFNVKTVDIKKDFIRVLRLGHYSDKHNSFIRIFLTF